MSGLSRKNYEFKTSQYKNKINELEILSRSLSEKNLKLKLENQDLKKELGCIKCVTEKRIHSLENKLDSCNIKLDIAKKCLNNIL